LSERDIAFVVTCEHARNAVPPGLRPLFRGRSRLLAGHEGYDRGALDFARLLARALQAPLFAGTVTRLVVDLNRSPGHRALHSPEVRALPEFDRQEIVRNYHSRYRQAVETEVAARVASGARVCHFSCHSFTPVRDGVARNADIALLYDPARARERAWCGWLREALAGLGLRVRRNYPYRGVSDGFTTALRRRHPEAAYAGIEIEINQALLRAGWPRLRRTLVQRLAATARGFATRQSA
jgi:predicted N-formylglutamate amidohydrolase